MANLNLMPSDLPIATEPLGLDDKLIVQQGNGGIVSQTTPAKLVNSVAPVASSGDSEAGTNNTKRMSPLGTKQSIASEVGVTIASYAQGQLANSAVQSVNGKTGNNISLTKVDVGLGNVDDTSDANKPISSATQAALNSKANSSVTITGSDGLEGGGDLTQSSTIVLDDMSKASLLLADTAVQPSVSITAGSGLTGGGTLAANITIALSSTSIASLAKADTAVQPSVLDGYATLAQLATKFDNPIGTTAQYIRGDGSLATFPSIPQGSVTSVGLIAPSGFTVSNTPITSSGNLTLAFAAGYQGYTSTEATKVSNLKSAAYELSTAFATAAQGALASTAVQPAGLTKAAVGLGNVDNTSDLNKPISTATQSALNGKASTATVTTTTNGLMIAADKVKLNGIAAGAQVNVPQVQPDWNAATGLGAILNKPSLGALSAKNNVDIPDINATGIPNSGNFLRGDGVWSPVAGAGTVTSVAMTVPTGLAIAGSPITGAGTLAVTYSAGYQGYTTAEATKVSNLKSAAYELSTSFASTAQGSKADSAIQTLTAGTNITISGTGTSRTINATVPAAPVTSVNTKTGAVTLNAGDVGAVNKSNDTGLGGFSSLSVSDGTKNSGTYTPTPVGSNFRTITNGGNFVLAAPTLSGSYNITIDIVNNASAGTVTFTGFAANNPKGDDLTATNGDKFKLHISKTGVGVTAQLEALQ